MDYKELEKKRLELFDQLKKEKEVMNYLSKYSTSQLKAELRRRKRG